MVIILFTRLYLSIFNKYIIYNLLFNLIKGENIMNTIKYFVVSIFVTLFLSNVSLAASMSWHTGWGATGEVLKTVQTAEGVFQGAGIVTGATFNDAGSGMMHNGEGQCFFSFDTVTSTNKGYCAWGDPDGDRIFTSFTGTIGGPGLDHGINTITGGTGKYAGITGSGPWECEPFLPNGGNVCRQSFEYELP